MDFTGDKLKMFVTDFDGTLADDNSEVSVEARYQLKRIGAKGILRVIATGRNLFSFKNAVNDDFPIDYLIFSSGIGIYDWKNKKLLQNYSLDKSSTKEIYTYLTKNDYDFMVQLPVPENHFFHCYSKNEPSGDYLSRIQHYESRGIFSVKECPEIASQFVIFCNEVEQYQSLKSIFANLKVIRATSPIDKRTMWVEILPMGVSKAFGIEYLKLMHTINHDNIIAVGNDYYDLDMVQFVRSDNAYLVSNAPIELQKEYNLIESNQKDGVAKLIERLY
jgi:hydroxymethylpyrimidine pyrophosphatase-like HAD family hydrolase